MRHEEVALPVELTDDQLEAVVGGMGLCGKGGKEEPKEECSSC